MRKTIAILFGGCSSEYEVSLQSAAAVLDAVDRKKYEVLKIGITRDGTWLEYEGGTDEIRDDGLSLIHILLRSTSFVFIIGIAVTFVLITGGLDLSVGRVMAMSGILSAMAAQSGMNLGICILAGLAFGFVIGLLNGLLIVKLNIPALIVTLGMMYVCDGLVLIVTMGSPVSVSYTHLDVYKRQGITNYTNYFNTISP